MKQKRLSNRELSTAFQELAFLLHGGAGMGDAVSFLSDQETDSHLKGVFGAAAAEIDGGAPLTDALRSTSCFPTYAIGLIEIGETSGHLEEALASLADYYDERERIETRTRSALLYPALLLMLMFVVIIILLTKVLPVFNDVYQSLGGQLTGLAGGLLALGGILDRILPFLCVLLGLVLVFLGAMALSPAARGAMAAWWERRFGDRGISRRMNDAHFAQAMTMGMRSGMPVDESVELAASLLQSSPGAMRRSRSCREALAQGAELVAALQQSRLLPDSACQLLALGVKSGMGDAAMENIAGRLSEDADLALEGLVSKVEPALVFLTSILVGAILLSVMLPLMNIMSAIG